MDEVPAMRGISCVKCDKQSACMYKSASHSEQAYCIDCIANEYPDAHIGKIEVVVSSSVKDAATPQPPPKGEGDIVLPFVIDALKARAEFGFKKYGTYLKTHNGRDALMDAFQEILDLTVYMAQLIKERDDGNCKEKD